LFRFGVKAWGKLRKQLIADHGPIKYIQTWEIHRSQYPHANVVIANKSLQLEAAEADRRRTFSMPQSKWSKGYFTQLLQDCGFGKQFRLTAMRSREDTARYLVKLANELTGAAVKDQVPVNAPPHFRRLRASVHLLPPRRSSDEFTGQIVRMPLEGESGLAIGEIDIADF
jgi:ribosomal protein S8